MPLNDLLLLWDTDLNLEGSEESSFSLIFMIEVFSIVMLYMLGNFLFLFVYLDLIGTDKVEWELDSLPII